MDLQVAEDLRFQQRDWLGQRIGRMVIAALVIAAFLGAFGPGPLSSAKATSSAGALQVDYARFVHRTADATLEVTANSELARDGELRLEFDDAYLDQMLILKVVPDPHEVMTSGPTTTYVFLVPDAHAWTSFRFTMEGQGAGPVSGTVRAGDSAVSLSQFLYP